MKKRFLSLLGILAPAAVFAEGETTTPITIPGLADAISTAEGTASAMATQLVPAAVTIVFAFAGILGVWAVWKLLRRGVKGA